MPAAFRDYYETLGLPRTASADEVKSAFRKLARKYHPDVAKDKKQGEIKFKEINEAYEVLGDPENRKKYDALGQHWNAPPGARPEPGRGFARGEPGGDDSREFHFEGTGFSDFFEQMFGGGRGFGGFSGGRTNGAAQGGMRHGQDIEGAISVTLEEALHGSVRPISFEAVDAATGAVRRESFKVHIPKGALEGQVIRVPGKGEAGAGGGEAGHLFLRVRLARHPDFRALGADLYHDLPLAPWEAVLGVTVRVPGLDGEIDLKIPAGTTNGRKLRLRGRGLPQPKSDERGDLYVVAEIELPTEVSSAERELWERLSQVSAFKPRG